MKSNLYSIFVFLIGLLVTYIGSNYYQKTELAAHKQEVISESQAISHNIQQQISKYAQQLQLTAQSWSTAAEINLHWTQQISTLKNFNPHIIDIKIYDFTGNQNLNIGTADYVHFDSDLQKAQQAKHREYLPKRLPVSNQNRIFMSPVFVLANNDTAAYIQIPIFIKNKLFAYLETAINISKLLEQQKQTFQLTSPFSISENGRTIFSVLPEASHINDVHEQMSFPIFGHQWKLMVWLNHQPVIYLYLPYIGGSTALLLALLTYLILLNRDYRNKILRHKKRLIKINNDFTASKSRLVHSNKLSSLGEIAAGIAHEINQPLQVICIHADLCNENLIKQEYHLVDKSFRTILAQVERIEKIVKQVGSFARDSELDNYHDQTPADIFSSVINIVSNQYQQEQVELRQVLPGSLPAVFCNKTQIEQVLVNLLINAKDAVEHSDRKVVFIKAHSKENRLYIEVSDSGSGIEADKLEQIFTPFYTTKTLGKGTGLGLSISYSIILQHNGELKVSSEIGKGSTFSVSLPLQKSPD
ncbi:sensor histidine kinase [Psychromonas ossibalaenae]|uniref:sensor histidine kinase n=1 Tax=Psychromonas ossibalaenae TaxID=444922 RepID=UPI0003625AC7|nr:ATP-binding protein [Psychromonas ossibalaenae]